MEFCCIDTETTGLYVPYGDRVCEIALICFGEEFNEKEVFASLINPEREISLGAYTVNRIEADELVDAPRFAEVADKINDLVREKILVGHNVHFDLDFIKNEFRLAGREYLPHTIIDTVEVARDLITSPSYGLGVLLHRFGIIAEPRHRALGDCRATFHLLFKLYALYCQKHGGDVVKFIERYRRCPQDSVNTLPEWIKVALESNTEIEILYTNRSNTAARRRIRPLSVYTAMGRTYLEAYCLLRKDRRTFLVERIEQPGIPE